MKTDKNEKKYLEQLILGSVPKRKKDFERAERENTMQVKSLKVGMKIIGSIFVGSPEKKLGHWAPFLGEVVAEEGKNWLIGSILSFNKHLVPCEKTKFGPKTKIRRQITLLGWKDEKIN